MAAKTNGAEWKRYYNDKKIWSDKGAWHEDEEIYVNGQLADLDLDVGKVEDTDVIKLTGGTIYTDESGEHYDSLEAHFKKWQKKQTVKTFCVECNLNQFEVVQKAIIKAGGKIL